MNKFFYFFVTILMFLVYACDIETSNNKPIVVDNPLDKRLTDLSGRMVDYLSEVPIDSLQIPRTIENGQLKGTKSKSWTSGFFPGLLWELYDYSQNEKIKHAAIQWSAFVEKEKNDGGTHDLGFKIFCPFGKAYQITHNEEYKKVFVTAAKTLSSRFNSKVRAIRSWDHHEHLWNYPVIIDNMMNLEMLFEATKVTGDSSFYHIANQHAMTTLKNHFRADNSSYHVVSYDPKTGEVEKKNTHQGLNHESDWSRGQAWGLTGFAVCYRYTGNKAYLDQAKKIAEFIFNHPNLPEDLIPYWDYDAPNIPNEPRDVSAAAITANGLLELSQLDKVNASKYLQWTDKILKSLELKQYQLNEAPFFLKHSVGSIPGEFEMDAPIIYADYFYVKALSKRAQMNLVN